MIDSHVFDTKVVNYETELDGSPFAVPEPRSGCRFVVAIGNKAGAKEIVGQDACLGKTIATLADFEVDPHTTILTGEIVFFTEFLRNVRNFDRDVFWVGHGRAKVEVLEVNRAEACTFSRQDAVEKELDQFKRCSVGANVAWETNSIATNGDAGAIRIIFIWRYFTDYHGVADFLPLAHWKS